MLIATSGSEAQDDESDAPPEGNSGLPNLHVAVVADLMIDLNNFFKSSAEVSSEFLSPGRIFPFKNSNLST
jgi:hypothetical protein